MMLLLLAWPLAAPACALDPLAAPLPRRSVCVRDCDGYFFPVGNLDHKSEITTHQAICASLCPQAETRLFVIPKGSENIEEAREARGGRLYSRFMAKLKASRASPAPCACHAAGGDPVDYKAVLNDPTLRAGDFIVTDKGVRVFRGGGFPHKNSDFTSLARVRDIPRFQRGVLAAIDRVVKTPRGRLMPTTGRHREARDLRRQQRTQLDLAPVR